jgi:hypothetical protein
MEPTFGSIKHQGRVSDLLTRSNGLISQISIAVKLSAHSETHSMNQEQPAITTPEDERINNAVLQAQANLVQAAILMAQAVAAWEQWAESKRYGSMTGSTSL